MRTAVLTVSSDLVHQRRTDETGPVVAELAEAAGANVDAMEVVPGDFDLIEDRLLTFVDDGFELVFTTGGCGLAPDDHVPEATLSVIDREIPGLTETMRAHAVQREPAAALSRGVSGSAGATLIINLPDTAEAVREAFDVLTPSLVAAVQLMRRARRT